MPLAAPSTSASPSTGFECFLAQAGSASMESGLRLGGFPSKVAVPVMLAAAAIPGHIDAATSPAASHILFPAARMLGSLVIANLILVVTVDVAFHPGGPRQVVEQLCFRLGHAHLRLSQNRCRLYYRAVAGVKPVTCNVPRAPCDVRSYVLRATRDVRCDVQRATPTRRFLRCLLNFKIVTVGSGTRRVAPTSHVARRTST